MPSFTPTDQFYGLQWHLAVIGRLGSTGGNTFGIERVWGEFRGQGVNVGVWDDGTQASHADLFLNYDSSRHVTVAGVGINNGQPVAGAHGTAVAGLIGAAVNGVGGVGVAFQSQITGVNIFNGAFDINTQYNNYVATLNSLRNFDITNHSYGFTSPSSHFGTTPSGRLAGFVDSINNGRDGLGTINFAAAGNNNTANGEDWKHHRSVITIAATDQTGYASTYSSYGSNVLVSAPGGSEAGDIFTTDLMGAAGYASGDYTATFNGTSAATPIASGVASLMLSANPNLGWRDVQSILSLSAIGTGSFNGAAGASENFSWRYNRADNWNGGGMHTSEDYGFGLVNAFQAVRMSEVWNLFGRSDTSNNEVVAGSGTATFNAAIPDLASVSRSLNVASNLLIESVAVTIRLQHTFFNDLAIDVTSPEGTTIRLTNGTGGNAATSDLPWTYTFNATGFRGENSFGAWTVRIADMFGGDTGTFISASVQAYGEATSVNDVYHYTDEVLTVLAQSGQSGRVTLNDTDGGIDWINASAMYRNVVLLLNAGTSSTLGGTTFLTMGAGVIENAVTGDGNDTIEGNGADNELRGMRGSDALVGFAGNDRLFGGDDADALVGGSGNDYLDGGSGLDIAQYTGSRAEFVIRQIAGSNGQGFSIYDARASSPEGLDEVWNVETMIFGGTLLNPSQLSPTGFYHVESDYNYDGRGDILWRDSATGQLVSWGMFGSAVQTAAVITANGRQVSLDSYWTESGIEDFSGDHRSDILWRGANGELTIWTMSGSVVHRSEHLRLNGSQVLLDNYWSVGQVGDLNGNGRGDILWRGQNGELVVWGMNGENIESANVVTLNGVQVQLNSSWTVAAQDDFGRDGRGDLLWRGPGGDIVMWGMNGAQIESASYVTLGGNPVQLDNSWSVGGTGDFNGDGFADILWRGTGGDLVVWLMSGSAIAAAGLVRNAGSPVALNSYWTVGNVADFSGDGRADIVWRGASGEIVTWGMNGFDITFAAHNTFGGARIDLATNWSVLA